MELVSLGSIHSDRRGSLQRIVSIGLHVLVAVAVLHGVHTVAKAKAHKPLTAIVLKPYAPGHSAVVPRPRPKIVPPVEQPKLTMKQPEPPPPASGGDPTGEADVTVAMADFFPDPKPDLSTLPRGTRGDVVIDVVIDVDGKVVDTQVDQGLGHGVDEAVMAVLQTWTFTPATKAGKPVASKQQLLFHFERG